MRGTQTVKLQTIGPRPYVQGSASSVQLRLGSRELTDGSGLLLIRSLWDQLRLGRLIDQRVGRIGGFFRSSTMVEIWVALLLYGGTVMEDLALFQRRGVRRLFGWVRVPDPTTFGRWLRRAAEVLEPVLSDLNWHLVRVRWSKVGVPRCVTLVLDSTVSVRYGRKQAGAEKGYNPKKPGRPSHHPLLATIAETGDLLGLRWRPGSSHTAEGAEDWLTVLVDRLYEAGVEEITVRLDKGFFSKRMIKHLESLHVHYLLKVPNHDWVRRHLGAARQSKKSGQITKDPTVDIWSRSGTLWGTRLLSLEWRKTDRVEDSLIESYRVIQRAHILTNIPAIPALSAWRAYNAGAVVEQRIEELGQLGAGKTAVDDLGGNALLWQMAALSYQLLHILRTTGLQGHWRRAQPHRLRTWVLRLPAGLTRHSRKSTAHLAPHEPVYKTLLGALRRIEQLHVQPDPLPA